MSSWTTIESDPGVFTALIESFGVKGLEFTELYSLDEDSFAQIAPVFGLIFLFKWTGEKDSREAMSDAPAGLFCAKQVVNNACATQAILGVLMNLEEEEKVELGSTLTDLRSFSRDLPYDMRGLAIENSEPIRKAHNSFARPEPFVSVESVATEKDDVFHFVAYVPHDGHVYELDGLKNGPIDLGPVGDKGWVDVARTAVAQRVEKYSASEIKFNLMAIVRDRRIVIQEEQQQLRAKLAKNPEDAEATVGLADLETAEAQEIEKRNAWNAENQRRRHNYVPLLVDLLKVLAGKKLLTGLIDKANNRATTNSNNAMKA